MLKSKYHISQIWKDGSERMLHHFLCAIKKEHTQPIKYATAGRQTLISNVLKCEEKRAGEP